MCASGGPRTPRAKLSPMRPPARVRRLWSAWIVIAAAWWWCAAAFGQPATLDPVPAMRASGRVLVDLEALARRYGWSSTEQAGTLTLRTGTGILTLFSASPDALWQPTGDDASVTVPLSMPPQVVGDAWYVPDDVLDLLGVARPGASVAVPGGTALLAFPPEPAAGEGYEVVDLGFGVVGVRFYQAGPTGPETLSMLVADLALLALAIPDQRGLLDDILTEGPMASDHPFLVTVTAVEPTTWVPSLTFIQRDLHFEARHPFRFQLVEGDAATVAPDRPVVGVALLPPRFDLEAPLRIRWGDVEAEVTFRPRR